MKNYIKSKEELLKRQKQLAGAIESLTAISFTMELEYCDDIGEINKDYAKTIENLKVAMADLDGILERHHGQTYNEKGGVK